MKTLYASPRVPFRSSKKKKGQRATSSTDGKRADPEFKQCDYSGCTRPNARHTLQRCWDRQKDERSKKKSGGLTTRSDNLTLQN